MNELPKGEGQVSEAMPKSNTIADRQDEYHQRARRRRIISPDRSDAFSDKTPQRSYKDILLEAQLTREEELVKRKISQKKEEEASKKGKVDKERDKERQKERKKRSRWDMGGSPTSNKKPKRSEWDEGPSTTNVGVATPSRSRWDETPKRESSAASKWDQTATPSATPSRSRWDMTPASDSAAKSKWDETPQGTPSGAETPKKSRSRWDETPANVSVMMTPGVTPVGAIGMETPTPGQFRPVTPEQVFAMRWENEIDYRNRVLTDEELNAVFPKDGYEILKPPKNYIPIRTPVRKLTATPTPMGPSGFMMQGGVRASDYGIPLKPPGNLPEIKAEDRPYFEKLLDGADETLLSPEEAKERKIMKLLLKVKNGTPAQRKQALRQLTDKARDFGPGPLFNKILPLLMSPTLEDQERHLLVKVIDRVLYKLDDLVRPYVHKILVVIEPLLIDEDYYARVEGREIISNLAKAAGLATMIATMRPDIDNLDEYVRNTTARAFAVVASALGIPSLMPFLKAVCQSKKSWQARHTGIKIIQQIAILMGCAVLPHLKNLVTIIEHGLKDDQQKVRTITALGLAALAEAAAPYGIESFDSVLKPLWYGIKQHRGKSLAAFLKAIGYIIPLMDSEYASYYTKEVMFVLIREFASPDEEMKKIVLKVVKQCVSTIGVESSYVRDEILPPFFKHFWIRRMALDRRNYKQLVDTTVELANKVGAAEILHRIVDDLKDESEPYRRMVMETIDNVIQNLGASDIDNRLEEVLIDGILYAFQEQTSDEAQVILNGFGTTVNALGERTKPYLPQICGTIKWRLNNKMPKVRQQSADLISRIAVVMKTCGDEKRMGHLGIVLYEYLGEEYPEVLGSILGALKAIVNVIGMTKMTPPIKDLLPRLTPILKNRHEKVQVSFEHFW